MKITTPSGLLEVPQDIKFEIKAAHPFFSDEGSASIPVTIPASVPNSSMLGWPERIDRMTRFVRQTSAIAECGAFRKQCRVVAESASRGGGISLCLALEESEIYVEAGKKTLKELMMHGGHYPTNMTVINPIEAYHCGHKYGTYGGDFPFALFPVASDVDGNGNVFLFNQAGSEFMNAPARTVKIGDQSVSVPEGYGVAPYMYLWYMINCVFKAAGFVMGANVFQDDEDLKLLVVVHNNADASCEYYGTNGTNWAFHFVNLLPDITLSELITWLRDKFGAVVVNNAGVISIRLMRDLLTQAPDYDLTASQSSDETLSYPEPSSLERSCDTSIQSAEPAAESIEQLRERHPSCHNAASMGAITGTGLFYIPALGKYYYKGGAGSPSLLGCDTFPYTRKSSMSKESISTDDCFLPMIQVNNKFIPYIGERSHCYLELNQEKVEQPLQVCYAFDNLNQSTGEETMSGSSYSYNPEGTVITKRYRIPQGSIVLVPHPALTPEGLAPFWDDYEKILLNGAPEVSVECDIPMADLVSMDITTPKLFKGAHVIIKEMTYVVTEHATAHTKLSLQLIPSYQDLVKPTAVNFESIIGWAYMTTRSVYEGNGYTILSTDGLSDYTDADKPRYVPKNVGVIAAERERWLKYKYTKTVKKWWGKSTTEYTSTHKWKEYFISQPE